MKRFTIKHAFALQSARGKLLMPGQFFSTEDEAQIAELETFAKDGACAEFVSTVEPKKEDNTVDPVDDITVVKGVGAKMAEKLAEKGIATLSALKVAMEDKAQEEAMKELLGTSYPKVLEFFTPAQ